MKKIAIYPKGVTAATALEVLIFSEELDDLNVELIEDTSGLISGNIVVFEVDRYDRALEPGLNPIPKPDLAKPFCDYVWNRYGY